MGDLHVEVRDCRVPIRCARLVGAVVTVVGRRQRIRHEEAWPGTLVRVPGHAMADLCRVTANAYAVQLAFMKFAVVVPLLFVVVSPLKWT
jgi:hypothetical protein